MTWQPELDELKKREALARRMGGPDKVKRQHDAGRLTIRERVDLLVDQGSLHEIGAIAGTAVYDDNNDLADLSPSNSFLARAQVNGRPVVVVGDDFTVRGGSADATIKEKNLMAERMANELCIPIVRFIEGSGGGGSVKTIETTGRANLPGGVGRASSYHLISDNLGTVPSVSLGLGPVAGLGAARMAASHYSVMVKETSQLFVAGPPVVNALGYNLDRNELGGWKVQTHCGAVDDAVDSEAEAIACARRFLTFLPDSVYSLPDRGPITDDPNRMEEALATVIPRDVRRVYKMRPLIDMVVDRGSFFEMGRYFGPSLEGGIEAAYRAEINSAADPQAKLREIETRLNKLRSPFRTAETFWVEEIIDARQTRPLMVAFANLAAPVRRTGKASFTMRP